MNTTFYTDETRKYGKTMQFYIITDEEPNSYDVGLRYMFNKSGKCTLDIFCEILQDINSLCENSEESNAGLFKKKKKNNIKNTMSDSASTEKNFNKQLDEYRSDGLPQDIGDWKQLNEDQQISMNNFFCGLHLLVGTADVAEESLKKFERKFLDGKLIGSGALPELKRFYRQESGTSR